MFASHSFPALCLPVGLSLEDPLLPFPPLPLAVKYDVGSDICFFSLFLGVRRRGKVAHGADAEVDGGVVDEPERKCTILTIQIYHLLP